MRIQMFAAAFAVAAAATSLPMTAAAATLNFSDLNSGSCGYLGNSATSQGFNFSDVSGGGLFLCNGGVIQNNTTPAMIAANTLSILDMAAADGGLFSLDSFFAGGRTSDFNPDTNTPQTATGLEVVGTTGAGTVTQTFSFSGLQFSQFTLNPGFTGLTSVRFTATGSSSAEFLINNLEVNASGSGAVPEPATWAMMIIGFGAAGSVIRRRKLVVA